MKYSWLTALVLWLLCNLLSADSVKTFDGKTLEGNITSIQDGQLVIQNPASQQPKINIPIEDATTIDFDSHSQLSGPDLRLAHPLLAKNPLVQTEGIPLRTGLHKLVIVFCGKTPMLSLAGENQKKRQVRKSHLTCPERGYTFMPSAGLDEEGFRLPDDPGRERTGLTFRLYRSQTPIDMRRINDREYEFVKKGRFEQLSADWPDAKTNLGIYTTLVRIESDGRYRFWLDGNDDAWLYLGNTPAEIKKLISGLKQPSANWRIELSGGGFVAGDLTAWTGQRLQIVTPHAGLPPLSIPLDQVETVHNLTATVHSRRRIARQPNADIVIATVAENRTTSIEGNVIAIENGVLVIEFQGDQRKIRLDKIIAVKTKGETFRRRTTYQLAKIGRDTVLPVVLKEISGSNVSLMATWGQELKLDNAASEALTLTVQNGRLQYLSDVAPDEVEQIPFFDRVVGWQKNRSLAGGPLIVGDKEYESGLAMHSKTKLTYDLGGAYERFMATVGIDPRMKLLGDVTLQIEADGKVVFSKDRLRGTDAPLEIDVQVGKANRLTLVTDFGEGQDVGDQVNWANARLVKSSSGN